MMISKKIRITAFLFLTAIFLTVGGIGTVSAAPDTWHEGFDTVAARDYSDEIFADCLSRQ